MMDPIPIPMYPQPDDRYTVVVTYLPPLPEPRTNINEPVNYRASEMRDYAQKAVLADRERIDRSEVVQFLYGADKLDDCYYGDGPPPGKPSFWWRSILRAAIRNP